MARERDAMMRFRPVHGDCGSPEYGSWVAMRTRCLRRRHIAYAHYHTLGIDPRWDDYRTFLADMGRKPFPNASIDRIDGTKGYGPDNCRWASAMEQAHNRSDNVNITARGVTKTLREWCRELGINRSTVYYRLRRGLTGESALTHGRTR